MAKAQAKEKAGQAAQVEDLGRIPRAKYLARADVDKDQSALEKREDKIHDGGRDIPASGLAKSLDGFLSRFLGETAFFPLPEDFFNVGHKRFDLGDGGHGHDSWPRDGIGLMAVQDIDWWPAEGINARSGEGAILDLAGWQLAKHQAGLAMATSFRGPWGLI